MLINWLQNHLIPCPFKYFTGIDCPGCGFQRSVVELIQGNIYKSFVLYPPAIPLLVFLLYIGADGFFKIGNQKRPTKKMLFIIVAVIVLFNYGFKLWEQHTHHTSALTAVM